MTDPYKTLQVDPEAEIEVIEAAYRRLARKYHPDTSPTPESSERMVALNRAWEELRDPDRRAAVDRARARATADSPADRATPASRPAAPEPMHNPYAPTHRSRAPHPFTQQGRASSPGDGSLRAAAQPRASEGPGSGPEAPSARTPRVTGGAMPGMDDGWAGPPPGNPAGSVLGFGRYASWSLGEIARRDLAYLEWLERSPIGRPFKPEVETLLRAHGRRGRA